MSSVSVSTFESKGFECRPEMAALSSGDNTLLSVERISLTVVTGFLQSEVVVVGD